MLYNFVKSGAYTRKGTQKNTRNLRQMRMTKKHPRKVDNLKSDVSICGLKWLIFPKPKMYRKVFERKHGVRELSTVIFAVNW